jgi:hypothetical protein
VVKSGGRVQKIDKEKAMRPKKITKDANRRKTGRQKRVIALKTGLLAAAVSLVMCLWIIVPVWADDAAEILPVNPVSGLDAEKSAGEGDLSYKLTGKIMSVQENALVINDSLYRVNVSVSYYTKNGGNAIPEQFSAGRTVGYRLNKEFEIIAMWLID